MQNPTQKDRLISGKEAEAILGIKKSKRYELVSAGLLRIIKIGRASRHSENETFALVEKFKAV